MYIHVLHVSILYLHMHIYTYVCYIYTYIYIYIYIHKMVATVARTQSLIKFQNLILITKHF